MRPIPDPTPNWPPPATLPTDRIRASRSLIIWLIALILTLTLGAIRCDLTARAGVTAQRLALTEMITVQVGSIAITFPTLVENSIVASVALSSLLFIHLSALLAPVSVANEWITLAALASGFIFISGCVRRISPAVASTLRIVLSCWAVGVPCAKYLIADFSESGLVSRVPDPIGVLLALSGRTSFSWEAALAIISLLVIGLFFHSPLGRARRS